MGPVLSMRSCLWSSRKLFFLYCSKLFQIDQGSFKKNISMDLIQPHLWCSTRGVLPGGRTRIGRTPWHMSHHSSCTRCMCSAHPCAFACTPLLQCGHRVLVTSRLDLLIKVWLLTVSGSSEVEIEINLNLCNSRSCACC